MSEAHRIAGCWSLLLVAIATIAGGCAARRSHTLSEAERATFRSARTVRMVVDGPAGWVAERGQAYLATKGIRAVRGKADLTVRLRLDVTTWRDPFPDVPVNVFDPRRPKGPPYFMAYEGDVTVEHAVGGTVGDHCSGSTEDDRVGISPADADLESTLFQVLCPVFGPRPPEVRRPRRRDPQRRRRRPIVPRGAR